MGKTIEQIKEEARQKGLTSVKRLADNGNSGIPGVTKVPSATEAIEQQALGAYNQSEHHYDPKAIEKEAEEGMERSLANIREVADELGKRKEWKEQMLKDGSWKTFPEPDVRTMDQVTIGLAYVAKEIRESQGQSGTTQTTKKVPEVKAPIIIVEEDESDETSANNDLKFDPVNIRKKNVTKKKRLRLQASGGRRALDVIGKLPNSNISIRYSPFANPIDQVVFKSELESFLMSLQLSSLQKILMNAVDRIEIIGKDPKKTTADILNDLHFADMKYLLANKCLSTGYKEVKYEDDCYNCKSTVTAPINIEDTIAHSIEKDLEERANMSDILDMESEGYTKRFKRSITSKQSIELYMDDEFGSINERTIEVTLKEPSIRRFISMKDKGYSNLVANAVLKKMVTVTEAKNQKQEILLQQLTINHEDFVFYNSSLFEALSLIDKIVISYSMDGVTKCTDTLSIDDFKVLKVSPESPEFEDTIDFLLHEVINRDVLIELFDIRREYHEGSQYFSLLEKALDLDLTNPLVCAECEVEETTVSAVILGFMLMKKLTD